MTGKVAVITGASEGIGAGLVTGYRRRGWAVVASAPTVRPSKDPEVLAVEGDIADPASAGRVIGGALERFGRLDSLVNNAGVRTGQRGFAGFTGPFAAVTLRSGRWRSYGGAGSQGSDTGQGRGRERQAPLTAPEVLVAVGLGLIGLMMDQPGGRMSTHTQPGDQDAA